MITITVVACSGHAPVAALSAEFDELGGSIGRGDGSTLVLLDPERRISRTHALILFRGGRYIVQDKGTAMPIQINGRALGQGQESMINAGDELVIGAYTLQVTLKSAAQSDATQFHTSPLAGKSVKDDPLALFGAGPSAKDPFADLISTAAAKPLVNQAPSLFDDPFAAHAPKSEQGGMIPSDFDPFAGLGERSAAPPDKASMGENFGLGSSSASPSIDELFGLGPASNVDPLAAGSPLAQPTGASGSSLNVDPLAALNKVSAEGVRDSRKVASQRNDTPEIHGFFQPPEAKPDPAMAKAAPVHDQPVAKKDEPTPVEDNMVLSWDENGAASGEIKTMIIHSRRREQHEDPAPNPSTAPDHGTPGTSLPQAGARAEFGATALTEDLARPVSAESSHASERGDIRNVAVASERAPVSHTAAAASSPAGQDELLHAFLQGAGVPDLNIAGGLNTETMHILGGILREATQGTLDLLLARAMIKHEVRAEMTMIVARENNPLKFSPNVEAALVHLLAPQTRGFMPPLKSMKDAYNDLRSHQFGFMAGMRAALAGVLLRFDPEKLEQRLIQKSMLDSLLPMNRKAKLWDLFESLYGDISKEAEEDFHALFGKEFVRAYEAQIDKLEQEEKNG
ncbi:MAG: type VI secretion system-associated FHA domain protein TagH [Pseudomonadota bacterium]